jgi:Neutral/alkaline non-lysosomal ceramidase.
MKAGFGFHDITPEIGMYTELFQKLSVDKIVTPLLVKVCILEGENPYASSVLVSADVMDFFTDSISDIRDIISNATGIPEKNIFLNSSHTHSAPYIYPKANRYLEKWNTGFLSEGYYESLLRAVQKSTVQAIENKEEIVLKHSRGYVSGVGCNRRVKLNDGSIGIRYGRNVPGELRDYPDGLIDPYAECLWFEKMNGELKGAYINYACHGTSYNQVSEICWDFMGFARKKVEDTLGGQVLFLQSCAGNISPGKYTVTSPFEDAMQLGKRLAGAVTESYKHATRIDTKLIEIVNKTIFLKGRTTYTGIELGKKLEAEIYKTREEQENNKVAPSGAMVISYLERLLMLEKYPDLQIPCEIGLIRIGELSMYFLPSECFIQYALEIKKSNGGKPVLVMAYSDCTLQYIPDSVAYEETGGYETDPDWCYSEKGNGEILLEAALKL